MRSHTADDPVGIDHKRQLDHCAEDTRYCDQLFGSAKLCKKDIFKLQDTIIEKTDRDQGKCETY
jgi:hypothetical protein